MGVGGGGWGVLRTSHSNHKVEITHRITEELNKHLKVQLSQRAKKLTVHSVLISYFHMSRTLQDT